MIRRLRETVFERLNRISPARRMLSAAHQMLAEKTLDDLAKQPGVVSIYHMRSPSWPRTFGLSDLDLAIVVDWQKTSRHASYHELAAALVRTKKRYKLLDLKAVFVVQRHDFPQLCALNAGFYWAEGFPIDSWELLRGPELRSEVGPRLRLTADTIAIAQQTFRHWPEVSRSQRKRREKISHLTGVSTLQSPYDCYRALESLAQNFSARNELDGEHHWQHLAWPWPQHFYVVPSGLSATEFEPHLVRWLATPSSQNVRLMGNRLFQLYLQDHADFLTFVPWSLTNKSSTPMDSKLCRALCADLLMEKGERMIQAAIHQRTRDAQFLTKKWHKYHCYLSLLHGDLPNTTISVPAVLTFHDVHELLEQTLATYQTRLLES